MFTDQPALPLVGWSALYHQSSAHQIPRPARRRNGDALASRGLGLKAPAGVQRAEPSGARREGAPAARRARRIGAGAGQRPAAVRGGPYVDSSHESGVQPSFALYRDAMAFHVRRFSAPSDGRPEAS